MRAPRPARSSSVTDPQAHTSAAPLPFPFSLQRNAAAEITGEFAGIFIPLRPAEIPGPPLYLALATLFSPSPHHSAAPRTLAAAPLTPAEPRLCSATAAPPLLRRSPGRTARRLRLDARVFPEPFPSAATHTDPGSTSLRELHRRATAGRRRRAPYAGHLLQYTAR